MEGAREILEARAQEYSRPAAAADPVGLIEIVVFLLAGESCAVESHHVGGIIPLADLALLPGVDPPVVGIIAWRGELLTILDIRGAIAGSAPASYEREQVLVLGDQEAAFGILVEEVRDLHRLPAAAIRPLSGSFAGKVPFATTVTESGTLLLDVPLLLDSFS